VEKAFCYLGKNISLHVRTQTIFTISTHPAYHKVWLKQEKCITDFKISTHPASNGYITSGMFVPHMSTMISSLPVHFYR